MSSGGLDDRINASVVRIRVGDEKKAVGSGVVLSKTEVLTCAHLVQGRAPKDVRVRLFDAPGFERGVLRFVPAVPDRGAWIPDSEDFTVLELDVALEMAGALQWSDESPTNGSAVAFAGFPAGGDALRRYESVVSQYDNGVQMLDGTQDPGCSGGPVLGRAQDGSPRLVGLLVARTTSNPPRGLYVPARTLHAALTAHDIEVPLSVPTRTTPSSLGSTKQEVRNMGAQTVPSAVFETSGPAKAALCKLLTSMFSTEELERLIAHHFDALKLAIAFNGAPATVAFNVVEALERNGRLAEVFERLVQERPDRKEEIEGVRRRFVRERPNDETAKCGEMPKGEDTLVIRLTIDGQQGVGVRLPSGAVLTAHARGGSPADEASVSVDLGPATKGCPRWRGWRRHPVCVWSDPSVEHVSPSAIAFGAAVSGPAVLVGVSGETPAELVAESGRWRAKVGDDQAEIGAIIFQRERECVGVVVNAEDGVISNVCTIDELRRHLSFRRVAGIEPVVLDGRQRDVVNAVESLLSRSSSLKGLWATLIDGLGHLPNQDLSIRELAEATLDLPGETVVEVASAIHQVLDADVLPLARELVEILLPWCYDELDPAHRSVDRDEAIVVYASNAAVAELIIAGREGRRAAYRLTGGESDPIGDAAVPQLLEHGFDKDGHRAYDAIVEDLSQRLRVKEEMVGAAVNRVAKDYRLLMKAKQKPKRAPFYVLVNDDASWSATRKLLDQNMRELLLVRMVENPDRTELDREIWTIVNNYVRGNDDG